PGHVNPRIASDGGVLVRLGQTEGSVDLCRLAGLMPAAAIIEILNEDGSMARVPQLTEFSRRHDLKMCTIADLIEYRMLRECLITRVEECGITNRFGQWRMIAYSSPADKGTHLALCMGDAGPADADGRVWQMGERNDAGRSRAIEQPVLIRVHSECMTGDVFRSMRCECGEQLVAAMEMIGAEGRGALIYLRQEGRGIGLASKMHAYRLQDQGLDTVQANEALGLPVDRRDYGIGAQILRDIGLSKVRILTNNPKKVSRLEVYGLNVVEQLPLEIPSNEINRQYLQTKKYKMGHDLKGV
ncbi:MAG: GTP cyclohydrolase II, partial [Planctomycetes bacterium]|nr:GTP cyclohydrolase II [Planctomycetota bacterium]